jgi:hypothetical protein
VVAIRCHDSIALCALKLNCAEVLVGSARPKLTLAGSAQVAHPLSLATASNEIPISVVVKGGERSRDWESSSSTRDGQRRRPEEFDNWVDDVSHQEPWMNVVRWYGLLLGHVDLPPPAIQTGSAPAYRRPLAP